MDRQTSGGGTKAFLAQLTLRMRGPSMSLREAWPAPLRLKDTIILTTKGLPDTMSLRRSTLHLHHMRTKNDLNIIITLLSFKVWV